MPRKLAAAETQDEIFVSAVVLGKALGLSQHSIHRLSTEGVLKKPQIEGRWPLIESVSAYITHIKSSAKSSDLLTAKIELTQEQARSKKLENDKLEGTLISVEEAEQAWGRLVGNCRSRLLAIPAKLGYELSSETNPNICFQILENEIYSALQELSEIEDEADARINHTA